MKRFKITIEVELPENYNEVAIDTDISDVIFNNGGEVLNIGEYEEIE